MKIYKLSKIIQHFTHYYNFETKKFDTLKSNLSSKNKTTSFKLAYRIYLKDKNIENSKDWGLAHYCCLWENDKIIK